MGVPKAPNATGAVLAISARPDAARGEKPSPIRMAPVTATGGAETGGPFEESTEAEGNQQQLQTSIVSDARQGILQHFERTVLGGQPVQEDDVEHDPADRQQTVGGAVECGRACHVRRHAKGEDRNQQGRAQGQQRRQVRLDVEKNARETSITTTGTAAMMVDSIGLSKGS